VRYVSRLGVTASLLLGAFGLVSCGSTSAPPASPAAVDNRAADEAAIRAADVRRRHLPFMPIARC